MALPNFYLVLVLLLVGSAAVTYAQVPSNLSAIAEEVQKNTAGKEEWSSGIADWVAPEEMQKSMPYYLAGYDYSHRPVVIWEAGKWDLKKWAENEKTRDDVYKYIEQYWFRTHNLTSPYADAEEGVVIIMDADKFSPAQLTSLEVIKLQLTSMRYGEKYEGNFADVFLINLSFVGQAWVNIVRPIAGRFIGKAETFGPNSDKWGPVLRNKIPKDQLPPWYTGHKDNYKPVQIWG